jgi:TolB protein
MTHMKSPLATLRPNTHPIGRKWKPWPSRAAPTFLSVTLLQAAAAYSNAAIRIFEGQTEIGAPGRAGSASVQAGKDACAMSGGGENMWFTNEAFHFVWKKVSGDFKLQAAIEWSRAGGNAHRKACLLVRQSLAPDSPYVDVSLHGDGLTSLQFRIAIPV